MIAEYRVALVVARSGLVPGQLAEVRQRIKEKAQFVAESLVLLVPGYEMTAPEETICASVRGLRIMSKVRIEFLPFDPHTGRAAERLVDLFQRRKVDEVWCCTTPGGSTRPNKVQTLGMKVTGGRGYNPVPYWVSMDESARKKEQKAWPINCR